MPPPDTTTGETSPGQEQKPGQTSDLTAGYAPQDGVFDELVDERGQVRDHWRKLLRNLNDMSTDEIARAWETAQRTIRDNGVTYNVYGDPQGMERPWELDPIPLLIGAEEWRELERGLIQRARLLNFICADLYGPQRLLTEGHLPAALVLGNPNFLRPMHNVGQPFDTFLHLIAIDLARAPDGRWWVLSDRTQAPSGAGYALENRVVMARALPDIFRETHVLRLASFFQTLRENLIRLSPREDPRIVLLTPGPFNETYFEHAYLARYLGFALVEGADLTVRDNRVYVKSLDGLKQVDMIVRRQDSDWCDPLALRPDSALGIAGLVEAVRAGNVVVANALGSGITECEAMMSFLPNLAKEILDEELLLPSTATWWCGQEEARDYVLGNLDDLAIAPAFRRLGGQTMPQDSRPAVELDPEERADLERAIRTRGYEHVGQEMVSLSTAPVWAGSKLAPGPMSLRVFLAAAGDTYVVMPGGLARLSDNDDAHAVSMQRGAGSKDTWVLSDGPISTFSLLQPPGHKLRLRRSGRDLPSRAADNLFWLGRYTERAEATVRMLRSLVSRLTDDADLINKADALNRLLDVLIEDGVAPESLRERVEESGIECLDHDLRHLLFDPDCPLGLANTLANVRRTAWLTRDRLSVDAWRTLNRLRADQVWQPRYGREIADSVNLLNELLRTLSAFSGMEGENMTRSYSWRFLDMGRRTERAGHMARLLQALVTEGDPETQGLLDLTLEIADSFMTYRSRYLSTLQLAPVTDLLLADDTNPRSVAFQIRRLEAHLEQLPGDPMRAGISNELKFIRKARIDLELADIVELCNAKTKKGLRKDLYNFLDQVMASLPAFSEELARTYFSHAAIVRPKRMGARGNAL
ncbi:MAG: circularly permuted type 2 ATP-grasp protein [Magnetovibrionaceae bacterium]